MQNCPFCDTRMSARAVACPAGHAQFGYRSAADGEIEVRWSGATQQRRTVVRKIEP